MLREFIAVILLPLGGSVVELCPWMTLSKRKHVCVCLLLDLCELRIRFFIV